jgi:hypothetical protein
MAVELNADAHGHRITSDGYLDLSYASVQHAMLGHAAMCMVLYYSVVYQAE